MHVVAYMDMSGQAHLASGHAALAELGRAGHAALRGHHRIGADLAVVAYLDEIVELHAAAYPGRPHHGAVDGGVGAYLHVVGYVYVARLRYLLIAVVGRSETEAVGSDDGARMDYASVAYTASAVDLCAGIYYGIVAHSHTVAYIGLGIYLRSGAYAGAFPDISESTHISIFRHLHPFGDEAWLLHTPPGRIHHLVDHRQQTRHGGIRIIHTDKRSTDRLLGDKIIADEHCR